MGYLRRFGDAFNYDIKTGGDDGLKALMGGRPIPKLRFNSMLDMGEGMEYYIFDPNTRTCWVSRTPILGYPEYMKKSSGEYRTAGLWPFWWGYREIPHSEAPEM